MTTANSSGVRTPWLPVERLQDPGLSGDVVATLGGPSRSADAQHRPLDRRAGELGHDVVAGVPADERSEPNVVRRGNKGRARIT